MKNQQKVCL